MFSAQFTLNDFCFHVSKISLMPSNAFMTDISSLALHVVVYHSRHSA